jgi:hypothetical protein
MLIYTVGRSHLLELFRSELQSDLVRMVDDSMSRRAYEQLMNLETKIRDSGNLQVPARPTRRPRHLLRHAGLGGAAPASARLDGRARAPKAPRAPTI